jgi:hypothetical protein
VGVDQSGDGGEARQVDGRFFGIGKAGADALNVAGVDGNSGIFPDFRAIPDSAEMVRSRGSEEGAKEGGEEQTCEHGAIMEEMEIGSGSMTRQFELA